VIIQSNSDEVIWSYMCVLRNYCDPK